MFFLDPSNGGAWPLLVGGVVCLVDSDNERDLDLPIVPGLASVGLWDRVVVLVAPLSTRPSRETGTRFSEGLSAYQSAHTRLSTAGL